MLRLASLRSSVRLRLLALVLLPLVLGLPILLGLLLWWSDTSYDRLLIFKITSDLVIADQHFRSVTADAGHKVQQLAESQRLARVLAAPQPEAAADFLLDAKRSAGFDFLTLLGPDGRVRATTGAEARGTAQAGWPVVEAALSGDPGTVIDLYDEERLRGIDPALALRAHMPLVPTRNAAPTERQFESRGMMIHAAAPVYGPDGRLAGALEGGLLLNRNLDFVDRINGLVYREGSLPLGSKGTATLFLDDVRVATNVRLFQGERALGTRVSRVVRDVVLGEGRTWLDRAFVVNDWYVSGYQPIIDSFGRRVGMLYVGYLEAPFREAKGQALGGIVAVFLVISVLGAWLSLRWAGRIFRPLERMDRTMTEVEGGDAAARVGPVNAGDEIGRLAQHFDQLLEALEARNAELRRWGDELDHKVAERTRALEAANETLREAQRQLVMSEKLAAIGQLTAGVAHEINNPVAVIQGNLDLLREVLGPNADGVRNELRLMDEQVNRIRLIVTKLLQFARPADYAGYVEQVDLNAAVDDCLVLVAPQMRKAEIRVVQDLRAARRVTISPNELQQVLVNLVVNAIHAMPEGGTLTLSTADWDERGAAVTVADTGHGIPTDALNRIFDPFFTTKKQQGTGLGLSVSFALVERYGGHITVDSTPDRGAAFTVWLLAEPEIVREAAERPTLPAS